MLCSFFQSFFAGVVRILCFLFWLCPHSLVVEFVSPGICSILLHDPSELSFPYVIFNSVCVTGDYNEHFVDSLSNSSWTIFKLINRPNFLRKFLSWICLFILPGSSSPLFSTPKGTYPKGVRDALRQLVSPLWLFPLKKYEPSQVCSSNRIPVRWLFYIINSVDKTNFFAVLLPHRRSATVLLKLTPLFIYYPLRFVSFGNSAFFRFHTRGKGSALFRGLTVGYVTVFCY